MLPFDIFVKKKWIDYLASIVLAAIVILSWTYVLYTTRLTGIKYLEQTFDSS